LAIFSAFYNIFSCPLVAFNSFVTVFNSYCTFNKFK